MVNAINEILEVKILQIKNSNNNIPAKRRQIKNAIYVTGVLLRQIIIGKVRKPKTKQTLPNHRKEDSQTRKTQKECRKNTPSRRWKTQPSIVTGKKNNRQNESYC